MNILITGGAGFVGSALAIALKINHPTYGVYCIDNLKRRGSELNISRLIEKKINFIHGDIRNKEDFYELPPIDIILECSAEPSVLAGINSSPEYLINTNLNGTINCLNFALKNKSSFIFLSTSRIYPIAQLEAINLSETDTRFEISVEQQLPGISIKGINENFPLNGYRSLYGASKLSSELFIQEYSQFYGLKSIINRCGVIAGPWQMGKVDQGVAVLWMAKHFWNQSLNYIGYGGKGKQVRDMLHIDDLCRLIDYEIINIEKLNNFIFNVGGGQEVSASLLELTKVCENISGNKIQIGSVSETRSADIRSYITDNSKISLLTGWKPEKTIPDIFSDIYLWIKSNQKHLEKILK